MGKSAAFNNLHAQVESSAPTVGPEEILHGELEKIIRDTRKAELRQNGCASSTITKAVSNTVSALKAFRTSNNLRAYDTVGAELMEPTHFARACELLYNLDLSDTTVERHISELNKRIRPWAITLKKQQLIHCESLSEALQELLTISGFSIAELARRSKVTRETLGTWVRGKELPSTPSTIKDIGRIETEAGLPAGALSKFCELKKIYIRSNRLKINIRPEDLKRVRQYLPNDYESLSAAKQQEIYDWVMSNIVLSPSDDEGEHVGNREPYRCKIRSDWLHVDTPGTFRAPEALQRQVEGLVDFKTAELTPFGKNRDPKNGRWSSEESRDSKLILLEIFFGALHKKGTAEEDISLENILDLGKVESFISYMRKRRGLYTETITAVLMTLAGHVNPENGYITQHREEILEGRCNISEEEWRERCVAANDFLWSRWRQIQPHLEIGRDPFLPVRVVLDTRKPLHAYYVIADEIRNRTPLAAANSLQRARCFRDLIMFRYAGQFALRAGNFSDLQVLPKGTSKTSMTKLRRRRSLELWWDPMAKIWMHRQPKTAFKNHSSPATKDIEIPLADMDDLYWELDEYLKLRELLLKGHPDPGNLIISDMTRGGSNRTDLTPAAFTQVWKNMIRRYGIYNPYTGQGAIAGLRVHPPHAARHILATHIVRVDGSFAKAAAAIFDTETVTAKRYAEFSAVHQYELARDVILSDPPKSQISGRMS